MFTAFFSKKYKLCNNHTAKICRPTFTPPIKLIDRLIT